MQPTSKKMKRLERKKKKMVALINIAELNDKDREELSRSPTMDIQTKTKAEKTSTEVVHDGRDTSEHNDSTFDSSSGSEPKLKKKKKKHAVMTTDGEDGERRKKKRRSGGEDKVDEWPDLPPPDHYTSLPGSYKRKFELEIQKERPTKMVKHFLELVKQQGEVLEQSHKPSFTDELANWKKDLERSKKKKEKNKKEETTAKVSAEEKNDSEVLRTDDNGNEKQEPRVLSEEDEIEELRKLLRLRKKQLKDVPMVRLKGVGKDADLDIVDQRTPVLPCDVQNLILFSQLGRDSPRFPRWVELKKAECVVRTVVLVVEGASAYHLFSKESACASLAGCDVKAEMVSPYCYNASVVEELCAVPLSSQQKKDLEKRFGKEISPEALLTDKVIKVLRSAFSITAIKPTSEENERKISLPPGDKFPRTELLLSAWQLIEEGYPLPYHNTPLGNRYPDYVMSKAQYTEVTPTSPLWALDCEMCLTRAGNELTRVSVVNEQHQTVYESLCLPPNPIINYLTEYSGITPKLLKGVTTRLEDIQRDLRNLFPPDVILVGQSLNGDLHALKMMHPYVIDTSIIFNLTGERRRKSKLSRLSQEFLGEAIQTAGAAGHDSVEDSLAALKLVQHKLSKSLVFGDAVLSGLKCADADAAYPPEHRASEFEDLKIQVGPAMATSLFKHITMEKKSVMVVGQEEKLAEYSLFVAAAVKENQQLVRTQTTEGNAETVAAACQANQTSTFTLAHTVLGDEDDIVLVDSWTRQILDSLCLNSLLVVVLVGSHDSHANGACLVKVKKINTALRHKDKPH